MRKRNILIGTIAAAVVGGGIAIATGVAGAQVQDAAACPNVTGGGAIINGLDTKVSDISLRSVSRGSISTTCTYGSTVTRVDLSFISSGGPVEEQVTSQQLKVVCGELNGGGVFVCGAADTATDELFRAGAIRIPQP